MRKVFTIREGSTGHRLYFLVLLGRSHFLGLALGTDQGGCSPLQRQRKVGTAVSLGVTCNNANTNSISELNNYQVDPHDLGDFITGTGSSNFN